MNKTNNKINKGKNCVFENTNEIYKQKKSNQKIKEQVNIRSEKKNITSVPRD